MHNAIKGPVAELQKPACLPAFPHRVDQVHLLPARLVKTLDQHRGRVLEVGVHHPKVFAAGIGESGKNGRLVAEVPAEKQAAHPRITLMS